MILFDARIGNKPGYKHLHLQNGLIHRIAEKREELQPGNDEQLIELHGARVVPGFINSHDHLDFNCYPQLGNRIYEDYTAWGKDIHSANAAVIKEIEMIPPALRIKWGLYKNLLGGFTTVVNHGKKIPVSDELIHVYQDCDCLHSPAFEKNWRSKLNLPFRKKKTVVMHMGEGTNAVAHEEISRVIKANFFRRKITAVHGVAMDEQQAAGLHALVWCPSSNFFLLGKTAAVNQLKQVVPVLFGTDSTLTASWAAADHFADALGSDMVTATELLDMLTGNAAKSWELRQKGSISEGMHADLLIKSGTDIFDKIPFEMVIVSGEARVINESIADWLNRLQANAFDRIILHGQPVLVKKGILSLAEEIMNYYAGLHLPFEINGQVNA